MQAPGPMIDMQIRIREKEAKRKNIDAVNTANKKRCEREERIAIVQLKAYWDLFPEAVKAGFRAIHCKKCGKQERVHSNVCRCNVIWHHCPLHRVDPPQHNLEKLRKNASNGNREEGKKKGNKSSTRIAPIIE